MSVSFGINVSCSHHHQLPQSGADTRTAQETAEEACSALPVLQEARGGRRSKAGTMQGASGTDAPSGFQVLRATMCAMSCDFRSHSCHHSWSSTLQRGRAGAGPLHQELEKDFLTVCELPAWHQLYEHLSPF